MAKRKYNRRRNSRRSTYNVVGGKLAAIVDTLTSQMADLREQKDDLMAAWKDNDWKWLAKVGYITKTQRDELLSDED